MQCDECSRLLAVHERLKGNSAAATQRLQEGAERRITLAEYRRLAAEANEARLEAELARLELEQHKRVHPIPRRVGTSGRVLEIPSRSLARTDAERVQKIAGLLFRALSTVERGGSTDDKSSGPVGEGSDQQVCATNEAADSAWWLL